MRTRVATGSDKKRRLTAVDLFCGSGAVTEALRRQGYRVLVAVDNDPIACRTYKQNGVVSPNEFRAAFGPLYVRGGHHKGLWAGGA